jgi:hypothetical protein
MLRYADFDGPQQAACDTAMEKFSEWLNSYHVGLNETWENDEGQTVPVRVTRSSYFAYDDPPLLLMDTGEQGDTYYRVMIFCLNPYHDEGGPNEMTCYFDEDGRMVHMDQLFDTMIQPIFNDGQLINAYDGG